MLNHHVRTPHRQCRNWHGTEPIDPTSNLSDSVGEGGVNRPGDVSNVQSRLNRVAPADGGPTAALEVDGSCGPLTTSAIKRFQQRYPGQLLADGRIDVNKNTWKKLLALSETGRPVEAGLPKQPTAGAGGESAATTAETIELLNIALFMSRWRILEAIRAIDISASDLEGCEARRWFAVGPKTMTLLEAYEELKPRLTELPTLDRCFHVVNSKTTIGVARDTLRRLRKVYTDMLDVIFQNTLTTPAAEKSGTRRFIRLVTDKYMKAMYPKGGAIASAGQGGWWLKNANLEHIRFNSANASDGDVITTLIHEMSHFVSHYSSYQIGNHHSKGLYNEAFNDTHAQAVQNSFCYEWYAFLASFKHQRKTPNASLVLT